MERVHEACAGLDVHKATVVATVRCSTAPPPPGKRVEVTESFATTVEGLLVLRDWLQSHGVTHVAMESTGVYWKPIYYLLEADFVLVLANAHHVKQVPGRKTDVRDSAWLAQLLEHGLIRSSFVPPPPIRELRQLTRERTALIQDRTRVVNRLHKVLEDAGVKLATVVSEVLGVSGRAMLEALASGTTDPHVLADLARGTLRQKLPALRTALQGRFQRYHALLVGQALAHVDHLEELIETLSGEIRERLLPFASTVTRLKTLPGVSDRVAETLVAELGVDLQTFPSAGHLASWAGVCPGQYESAGRRKSGKTRHGNRWGRGALHMSATAVVRRRTPGALGLRYRRILRRRGHAKALRAVEHAQIVAIYHMLTRGQDYRDLPPILQDERAAERATRRAIQLLEREGYSVMRAA
ncbi:MAG TPA: IS110 family transposase [Planctomycetota bacterium]|nr:IS110 family transposase [Planctomycetota bacterium]